MRKITKKSSYKQYHLEPDGTLRFVGEFKYSYEIEVAPKDRTRILPQTEGMLAASYQKQLADEEAFERLVDAASDDNNWEG